MGAYYVTAISVISPTTPVSSPTNNFLPSHVTSGILEVNNMVLYSGVMEGGSYSFQVPLSSGESGQSGRERERFQRSGGMLRRETCALRRKGGCCSAHAVLFVL
ncbi:hypothetical protein KC19_1G239800 [Ceratodon purpureus]|uniref:Uncharacterized protein n=1 Tax=Ceratodon purpureus TaxID=3225 RepID=A0A8T0JC58_CERPU|nr:hypothetical protein KC19_1G239800 [Ceratodon purpureus]